MNKFLYAVPLFIFAGILTYIVLGIVSFIAIVLSIFS